ncbi:putative HTH-type transcriptional regulator [Maritalea myrionectae]|uniref:Putative HTH-type transcriptional regulator n=1 Tax=Maritalea myrionectae TaxID=454601 RepID=A0A2R4MFZ1_9HYPH|nr:FCD domain-containing protein [Maritalea myrionectae]AVX04920.1 putative HTH-type transcriptional regulator [Maritalea myrionectae]
MTSTQENYADIEQSLREGLISGVFLKDGRLIAERELAKRLDVSRTKLRRVLDLLEQDGVIFRRQGQGTFLLPPPLPNQPRVQQLASTVTPREVMEVRLEVEPALAALTAERATGDDLRQLQGFAEATTNARSTDQYERADDIFHYKIAQMAKNPLFLAIYEEIRAVRQQAGWTERRASTYSEETIAELGVEHNDILNAISANDPRAAALSMRKHLVHVSNTMLRDRWYD